MVPQRHGTGRGQSGEAIMLTLGPLGAKKAVRPSAAHAMRKWSALLAQVTQWRSEDDLVIFSGPTELRFHLSTH